MHSQTTKEFNQFNFVFLLVRLLKFFFLFNKLSVYTTRHLVYHRSNVEDTGRVIGVRKASMESKGRPYWKTQPNGCCGLIPSGN